MTIELSTENVYLIAILFLMVLQISQWYYIFSIKKQMNAVWAQIAAMALMFYARESNKDVQAQTQQEK